jgi:transposase-like protein
MEIQDEGFEDALAILNLPAAIRRILQTSNGTERLNEEIRGRERVIRIFSNEASINRLVGAMLMEYHEKWIGGKGYFNMFQCYEERDDAREAAEKIHEGKATSVA